MSEFAQIHVGQTFETLREVKDALRMFHEAKSLSSPTRPTTVEGWQAVIDVLNWLVMEKTRLTPTICESSSLSMTLDYTLITICCGRRGRGERRIPRSMEGNGIHACVKIRHFKWWDFLE